MIIGYLNRPTQDGRVLLEATTARSPVPVFGSNEPVCEHIGTAEIRIEEGTIHADITWHTKPAPGLYACMQLDDVETKAVYAGDLTTVLMTGTVSALFLDDNPGWPDQDKTGDWYVTP